MLLTLPAVASGATFYVDRDAVSPQRPCTSPVPARACHTITQAVQQARGVTGPNIIRVARGRYVEEVQLDEPEDAGLTIEGAGAGSGPADPATQTILEYGNDDGFNDAALDIGSPAPRVVVRGLRVQVPTGAEFLNDPAIEVRGGDTVLEEVRAEVLEPTAGTALMLSADGSRATRVTATSADGAALRIILGVGITVRDSQFSSGGGTAATTLGRGVRIARSVFSSPGESPPGAALFAQGGSLSVDSSLLVGGRAGLDAFSSDVTLRHVTVDAGEPKLADPDAVGLSARADAGDSARISLFDSIVLEEAALSQAGHKEIVCRLSDVPDQVETATQGTGSIACPAAPGNPADNQTSSAAALFAAGALDWRLRPGSPAVDQGSVGMLSGGGGAVDLDGNPRVVDGDGDGAAASDMGAYELPPASAPSPPTPTAGAGPTSGARRGAVDRSAPVISRLSLTNRRFRVGRRTQAIAARRPAPRGTTFRFNLSEAARVGFRIDRRASGRRLAGRCRRQTLRNRTGRRCVRHLTVLRFSRPGRTGRNRAPFSGRLRTGRPRRALDPGRYRATLTATDAAGNRSRPRRARFEVVSTRKATDEEQP